MNLHRILPEIHNAELNFDGDMLTQTVLRRGFQERPIWKRIESLSPKEMLLWIDRLDSLCPIASEWALAQAIENAMGITVAKRGQYVRTILCEINRLVWLTTYLSRVTGVLGQRTLSEQVLSLREQVFVTQEELTGGRILPQALTIGGCRRDLALGDVQKVRQFIQGWRFSWNHWWELVSNDPLLDERLRGLMTLDPELIRRWAWWGVAGKASGVAYDARKHRPHGAYMYADFKLVSKERGDAQARFEVAASEVMVSVGLIEKLLSDIPGQLETRPEEKPMEAGIYYGTAESAKGPVVAAIEVSDAKVITTTRLFLTGQRVWPHVDELLKNIRSEDFQLAFASLGVDSEESET